MNEIRKGTKFFIGDDLHTIALGTVDKTRWLRGGTHVEIIGVDVVGWNARVTLTVIGTNGRSMNLVTAERYHVYFDINLPERNVEPTFDMIPYVND